MRIRQKPKFTFRRLQDAAFCRLLALSFFGAAGILIGTIVSRRIPAETILDLRAYLESYVVMSDGSNHFLVVIETIWIYFRCIAGLLLLSFCTIGIYLIPVFCGVTSFALAFSVSTFWTCFEQGFLPTVTLFLLRTMLILPTMLYFGSAAMLSAVRGKEGRGHTYWREFGVCACILFLGAILEITVVPSVFGIVFSNSY